VRCSAPTVLVLALAASAAGIAPRGALAQPQAAQEAAVAQALFDAAMPALRAGDFAVACPKLEQVVALAPSGTGAKLRLAECYEGLGRLASAWSMYTAVEAAAAQARQEERQAKAHDRARALKPSLALLTVVVPAAAAAIPGLELRRDGLPVSPVEWGLAIPVDKGKHVLVATAPGRQPWEQAVDLPRDGALASVTVGELALQAVQPAIPKVHEEPRALRRAPSQWTAMRTAGVALAAVGLTSIGVGSFFGLAAIDKRNQSNMEHCLPDNHCDATGLGLRDEGLRDAAAATALFITGGAALVGGVTLIAIPPRASGGAEAKVALAASGIDLRGTW
jgi:hypothetical protein